MSECVCVCVCVCACVCVCVFLCMHLYAFVEGAPVLALLVLHKTVVTDDDTLSVFMPKTAQHNLP